MATDVWHRCRFTAAWCAISGGAYLYFFIQGLT
jgi:hypothetical protein